MSQNASDAMFGNAGKKAGLQIWRIENMSLAEVPKDMFGTFFTGDSYIALHTQSCSGSKLSWDIFFWLGGASSQDERGAAAILSIQMDDYLGGGPVQHREEQGYESNPFISLFKNGLRYLKGGVASGFKQIKINVKEVQRLLHIKGSRFVRSTEVEAKWGSFNSGDVFILQSKNDLFVWKGKKANQREGFKAMQVANNIKNIDNAGKGTICHVNEGEVIPKTMLQDLSGKPSDVKDEIPDDDSTKKRAAPVAATLHHVSSDSGKLIVKEIKKAPFSQSDLDGGDCYIVDNGANGKIYVWKGKSASKDERKGALVNADSFISQRNYPKHVSIEIIPQGSEPVMFREFFRDWRAKDEVVGFGKVYSDNKIAKVKQTKIDIKSLTTNRKLAAKHGMVDDGSGTLEIWRVEKKLVKIPKDQCGTFYSGDCYVMLYTYKVNRKENYIVYYWQGAFATLDEVTASAFFAVQLDDEKGGAPIQVRVVQGKEPPHLLKCFGGKPMVILSGGRSTSGKNVKFDKTKTNLFQIYCTEAGGSKTSQVEAIGKSLNSNDTFLLSSATKCFIWKGKGTSVDETAAAKTTNEMLKLPAATEVNEGSEPTEFWSMLGGKTAYSNHPRLQLNDTSSHPPRLFAISNSSGKISVEEICNFAQQDLEPDDVMMLDVWNEVFVWIGKGANDTEKKASMTIAQDYIKADAKGRDPDTPVVAVKMGNEPMTFTGFFPAWEENYKYHQA